MIRAETAQVLEALAELTPDERAIVVALVDLGRLAGAAVESLPDDRANLVLFVVEVLAAGTEAIPIPWGV